MRIWKYQIPLKDSFTINMPSGADVLCVQLQGGLPTIWAAVNPEAPLLDVAFVLHGTGHQVSDEAGPYIGTFQLSNGLVFHLFEAIA